MAPVPKNTKLREREMGPVAKNSKFHFTHPNHPLTYLSGDQDYFCDGCKTLGSDGRFRCHGCDFDLHEYCANCPEKLSSFTHHHRLTLAVFQPQSKPLNQRACDVCHELVEGLFYRCKDCDFDAHPLCTQLPKQLRHVADNIHSLNLQKLPFGTCVVCTTDCSSLWVYGCQICKVNIHLDCLLEPYQSPPAKSPPPSRDLSGTTSRGISFAPPPQPPWAARPPPVPYGFAVPYGVPDYGYPFGHPYNYVNYPHYQASQYGYAPPTPPPPPPPPPRPGGGKLRKSMFFLVGRLAIAAVTTSIFGVPLSF